MTSPPHLPQLGDLIDGKYRIEAIVGQGGTTVVFAATHVGLERRRALKWLLPNRARDEKAVVRFLSEARNAAKIDHVNVASPIDISENTNAPYVVMELLEGQTLAGYMGDAAMPLERAGGILLPLLHGVAAGHAKQIVHGDLKPSNVFLAQSRDHGQVPKVLDFGMAKVMDGQQTGTLTDQTALLSSIQYMSPEQMQDARTVGPASDVYALGVLLYRMLSGRLPFEGDVLDLALRIRQGRPTPLAVHSPNLPAGFEAVAMRAFASRLDARYPDVRSFATALKPYFPGQELDFSTRPRRPTPIAAATPPSSATPDDAASSTPAVDQFRRAHMGLPVLAVADLPVVETPTFRPVTTTAPAAARRSPWRPLAFAGAAAAAIALCVALLKLFGAREPTAAEVRATPQGPTATSAEHATSAAALPSPTVPAQRPAPTPDDNQAAGWEDLSQAPGAEAPAIGGADAVAPLAARSGDTEPEARAPRKQSSERSSAGHRDPKEQASHHTPAPTRARAPAVDPLDTILGTDTSAPTRH